MHNKPWKAPLAWLLDTSLINAFMIWAEFRPEAHTKNGRIFRKLLIRRLLEEGERTTKVYETLPSHAEALKPSVGEHKQVQGHLLRPCAVCKEENRLSRLSAQRVPFSELSSNSLTLGRRRKHPPRTRWRCSICNINICYLKRCWEQHVGLVEAMDREKEKDKFVG